MNQDSIETTSLKNGPIKWMAQNHVAANLFMLVLLIGGVLICLHIKQEVFPEFTLDVVTVSVPYPGAGPEEIEKAILLPVEEAVTGLDDVKEITSVAREGIGTVNIEMVTGGDLQKLFDDTKNEINRIRSFPEDAEDPVVVISNRRRDVITLVLYGDLSTATLHELAIEFKDTILEDNSITMVEISGIPAKEIAIEIPMEQLRKYQLTLAEVANRIRRSSIELPGGAVRTKNGEILIRLTDRKDYGKEFAKLPVIWDGEGTPVTLEQIATIKDGYEDKDFMFLYDGKPAVQLEVYRSGRQTPISIAHTVRKYLDEYNASLPEKVKVAVLSDHSKIYEQRLDLLLRNGLFGWILVILLLSIFLEVKLAFWVAMGVPVSFLGSFLILPMFGISINMISLFAFIISLGIVVDDAIVVGENIYSHHQNGLPFSKAVITGTREVAMPVVFSILTNMAAFLPLYFVPGIMGKIFKSIPVVVISVFFVSLLECLFALPSHLYSNDRKKHFRIMDWLHQKQQNFSHRFKRAIFNYFGPLLKNIIIFRYLAIAVGLSLLIFVICYVKSGRIGMTSFMKVEADYAKVTLTLPYGSPFAKTKGIVDEIITKAKETIKENDGERLSLGISSTIGAGMNVTGPHMADIRVYLTDPEVRPISTETFTQKLREKVGRIPGVEKVLFESDAGGPGSGAALSIELSHRNKNILERAASELAQNLEAYPLVKDVDNGFSKGKEQLDFKIKPMGRLLGLTSQEIARQIRDGYFGNEIIRQLRGTHEIKIMVRLPETERSYEYDLESFIIRTPAGKEVPLREVTDITRGKAFTSINRKNMKRVLNVTSDVTPRSKTGEVKEGLLKEDLPRLQKKYSGLTYRFTGREQDIQESNQALIMGLLLALILIYALLAIPFKSYIQPFIIMVSIPFGIVGAVLGHFVMGYPLSILSMFGIVALSGVVVNDSLVLIEFANRKKEEGLSSEEAIVFSACHRFRPIMLTTLTTFGGLAPMIFETSRQAKFLIPMALSLGYGILFATVITLILVPCLYLMIEDIKRLYTFD